MDIFIVLAVFLVIEAAICAVCAFLFRERRLTSEQEKQSKRTSHHSLTHLPHVTHGTDHHNEWSHASSQQPKGIDSKVHFSYLPSRLDL
jgi:hypothetical protein